MDASDGIKAVTTIPRREEGSQKNKGRHSNPAKRIAIPKPAFKRLDTSGSIGDSETVHRELRQ